MRKFLLKYSSSILLMLIVVSTCIAQEKLRTVDNGKAYSNAPIEVVSRKLGDKQFTDDNKVVAGRDWLQSLSLNIKNISSKTIVLIEINLIVAKKGLLPTSVSFPLRFGTPLFFFDGKDEVPVVKKDRKLLAPGETVELSISSHDFSVFTAYLRKYEVDDLDSVTIDIRNVEFNDGTGWIFGREWKRNSRQNREKRMGSDLRYCDSNRKSQHRRPDPVPRSFIFRMLA